MTRESSSAKATEDKQKNPSTSLPSARLGTGGTGKKTKKSASASSATSSSAKAVEDKKAMDDKKTAADKPVSAKTVTDKQAGKRAKKAKKRVNKKEEGKKGAKAEEQKKKPENEVKDADSSGSEFDRFKVYPIETALGFAKKLSKTKFDASVEVHFRLGIDPRKGDQRVRSAVSLPHGTGKTVKVAAFVAPDKEKEVKAAGADYVGGEELIAEIKKTEKTDFEVAVAEPAMMKFLGQIGKILGTRGLMPSPKNETVTPDPAKAVAELKKGKVSFKNDDTANVHVAIGKVSFDAKKLLENYETLFEAIKRAKPPISKGVYFRNITISTTMGPGIKVAVT